jgi:hypothetical protein
MEDYAKAAAIFKPVSGAMAGRFVGATVGTMMMGAGPAIGEGGLYQPTFEKKEEGSHFFDSHLRRPTDAFGG